MMTDVPWRREIDKAKFAQFWDFGPGILRDEIDWYPSAAIVSSQYFRPSDLVALGCDDLSIRVVDIETKKVVRELWGCAGQISDFVRSFMNLNAIIANSVGSASPMTAAGLLLLPWIPSSVSGTFPRAT